jgi:hypothetical protein
VTADLASGILAAIRDRPLTTQTGPAQVMECLAAFQAEPCASGWYGFVVRLGLLIQAWEVHTLLGDLDPFPAVTSLALADARLARNAVAGHTTD